MTASLMVHGVYLRVHDWLLSQGLVDRGIYPGVEYRILDISIVPWAVGEAPSALKTAREAPDGTFETGELVLTMRPVYPLVSRLERPWPVRVPARELPVLLEPFYYNAATAWAALTTSLSFLTLGFVLSQALTLSVIPSRSMEPTLQVGTRMLGVDVWIVADSVIATMGRILVYPKLSEASFVA